MVTADDYAALIDPTGVAMPNDGECPLTLSLSLKERGDDYRGRIRGGNRPGTQGRGQGCVPVFRMATPLGGRLCQNVNKSIFPPVNRGLPLVGPAPSWLRWSPITCTQLWR